MIADKPARARPTAEVAEVYEIARKPRPNYKPEEGESDRSDWLGLAKAVSLGVAGIALLSMMLSR